MIWDLLTPSLNMLYAYFATVLLTIVPSPHWTQQASWQKYEQDQKCRHKHIVNLLGHTYTMCKVFRDIEGR